MSIADTFNDFLSNLAVDNADTISSRYGEITAALNKKFRDTESKTANSLQVGSYGRKTAIKGISDLDMLYIMPASKWDIYKDGGQSKLLRDAANAISSRYPTTLVKVDRLVVRVLYQNFHVEVQPVFQQADDSFKYPDTYNDGSWKITKPREEIAAMKEFDVQKNSNLRRLCKMARAWKNKHGVGMGGLLVDTLAHNFLNSTSYYDDKSYLYYDLMSRDFFGYLKDLPKQDYFAALGSGQRVSVKKQFQRKAKKAYNLCVKAIEAEGKTTQNSKWRKVYGRPFPSATETLAKSFMAEDGSQARNTEEFFEDQFAYDVRYNIKIDCEVTQDGFRPYFLTNALASRLRLKRDKSLRFFVTSDIPGEYTMFWKVLNRGPKAIKRDCIRGQLIPDRGKHTRTESTNFFGDHIVECVALQNGVVVATDRIVVPID
ncbi:SMODS domain-containing nucleotidyltransferase [Parasphingorhabdus sp.]|uniref:SMODS domain-containing nucleotidyltransferase n=1 Tax=Parasphingorhabdus sp. TaxID=2709688 RepID=UPI003BB056DA